MEEASQDGPQQAGTNYIAGENDSGTEKVVSILQAQIFIKIIAEKAPNLDAGPAFATMSAAIKENANKLDLDCFKQVYELV